METQEKHREYGIPSREPCPLVSREAEAFGDAKQEGAYPSG